MPFYIDDKDNGLRGSDLRATREPCIVCGHPTGDCAAGDPLQPMDIQLLGTVPSLEDSQTVYIEEDVYGERTVGELVTVKFLIARKGSQLRLSLARELGII